MRTRQVSLAISFATALTAFAVFMHINVGMPLLPVVLFCLLSLGLATLALLRPRAVASITGGSLSRNAKVYVASCGLAFAVMLLGMILALPFAGFSAVLDVGTWQFSIGFLLLSLVVYPWVSKRLK